MVQKKDEDFKIRVPNALNLKDIISILAVIVSITLAWGVNSTRLTVIEKEIISTNEQVQRLRKDVDEINTRARVTESRTQETEGLIDRIFEILKKPPPTRHAPQR